jgi:hypothetical protein
VNTQIVELAPNQPLSLPEQAGVKERWSDSGMPIVCLMVALIPIEI